MLSPSIRYQGGPGDLRSLFIRLCAWLQRQPIAFIDDDPRAIGAVLGSSPHKGRFLEERIACPAWEPIRSVESVDGPEWEALSGTFRTVFRRLRWRERLPAAVEREVARVVASEGAVVDAPTLSRITASALHHVVFGVRAPAEVLDLMYAASVEWRKEIAIKGSGDRKVKDAFVTWLDGALRRSCWADLVESEEHGSRVLSAIAQPLLISPQINIADIFVTLFAELEKDPDRMAQVRTWAEQGEVALLNGAVMEAIRLGHPFPVLERWMTRDVDVGGRHFGKGTQVFMMMDSLQQDDGFKPERWTGPRGDNPYASLPFGSGPRMCTGRPLAEMLMVELLRSLLTQVPANRLQPQVGNPYSGRANDGKDDIGGILHQVRVFGRVLLQSVGLGLRGEGGCPFHSA